MGKIVEYISKKTLTPDDKGYSALETAARRVGPLFQQAAGDVLTQGKMQAEAAKDTLKFGYEFENPIVRGGGGGGVRTGGGREDRSLIGTGSNNTIIRNERDPTDFESDPLKATGDIAKAAANITQRTNQLLQQTAAGPLVPDIRNGVPGMYPANNGPDQTTTPSGVTIIRGGPPGVSDIENGVSVLRGNMTNRPSLISVPDWTGTGPQLGYTTPQEPGSQLDRAMTKTPANEPFTPVAPSIFPQNKEGEALAPDYGAPLTKKQIANAPSGTSESPSVDPDNPGIQTQPLAPPSTGWIGNLTTSVGSFFRSFDSSTTNDSTTNQEEE